MDRSLKTCSQSAFTLLEVLMVIGILILLAALTLPAVSGLQRSYQLGKSGGLLQGHLELARQLAITGNTPVIASLCMTRDESGNEGFNTLYLSRPGPGGELEAVARPLRLPPGFTISSDREWSSLMDLEERELGLPSGRVPCRQIRFGASGSTDLPPSRNWFITVYHGETNPERNSNFITLAIEPVTGRVFQYQP